MVDAWWMMDDDGGWQKMFNSVYFWDLLMRLWCLCEKMFGDAVWPDRARSPGQLLDWTSRNSPSSPACRPNTGGSISCMISHCVTSHFTSLSLWYTVLTCCIWQVYSIESLYNGGVSKMGSLTIHRVFYWPFCHLTQQRPVCRVRSWPIGLTGKGSYLISIARMRSMRRSFSLSKSCVCTLNVLHVCLTMSSRCCMSLHGT